MKREVPKQAKKENEFTMRPCVHGSLFCFCKHNLASAVALPGRPKYAPAIKQSKKPKLKKALKEAA